VLEPSCAATFRDELCALLPRDEDSRRSKQTFVRSEFLEREGARFAPPRLARKVGVRALRRLTAVAVLAGVAALIRLAGSRRAWRR
jgi:hypothetical protein